MLLLLALTLAAVAGLFGGADHLLPGLEGGVLCDGVIVAYGLGVDVGLRRLSANLPAQLTVFGDRAIRVACVTMAMCQCKT